MRSFALISMLLAATQVFAAPTPTTPAASIGARAEAVSEDSELYGSHFLYSSLKARDVLSNAERFARGLPPAPLKQEHRVARRSRAPPCPQIIKRGIIQVSNSADDQILGYISKNAFEAAQYQYQPDEADALIVTFEVDSGATSVSTADFSSENSNTGFPFTGLVSGRDNRNSDLASGSFHYAYIAGTNQTPACSPPLNVGNSYSQATGLQRPSESAVWSVDLTTGATTVQWVNSDGSKPCISIFIQGVALYISGDSAAFNAEYPAPIVQVSFTFLERP